METDSLINKTLLIRFCLHILCGLSYQNKSQSMACSERQWPCDWRTPFHHFRVKKKLWEHFWSVIKFWSTIKCFERLHFNCEYLWKSNLMACEITYIWEVVCKITFTCTSQVLEYTSFKTVSDVLQISQ